MPIVLNKHYRGKPSGERLIAPGTYAENNPALFGLAGYLVSKGHATQIGDATTAQEIPVTVTNTDPAPVPDDPPVDSAPTTPADYGDVPDFEAMTIAELRDYADIYDIPLTGRLKAEIIAEIEQHV